MKKCKNDICVYVDKLVDSVDFLKKSSEKLTDDSENEILGRLGVNVTELGQSIKIMKSDMEE